MKKTAVCIALIMVFIAVGLRAEDMPKNLKFQSEPLTLANQESDESQFLAEYIPPQKNFDNYDHMFALFFYKGLETKAAEAAAQKLAEVKARKEKGDSLAGGIVYTKKSASKEAVLDFTVSEGGIVENNIMFFKNTPKGLLLVKYVQRFYEEGKTMTDVKKFTKQLKEKRQAVVDELSKKGWPLPDMAQ